MFHDALVPFAERRIISMRSEIEEYLTENAKVTVSVDHMLAYLSLSPWSEDTKPDVRELVSFLEEQGITTGIEKANLDTLLNEKIFYQNVLIAQGVEMENGKDGWLEYLVDVSEKNQKPTILPDGSVDYSSIGNIEVLEAGTVIAKYHPATTGVNGITVYGEEKKARPGRQLPKMHGEGFTISEDGTTYTTTINGRVFMKNGKLCVSKLYEVAGDVDNTTGNIDFNGDIIVHGTVISGMRIRATGNLTIEGHVEGAELIAGGNIILKTGMQGGGKGTVRAGGDVEGKFFEQVKVATLGTLRANSLLNCTVDAGDSVLITGRFGVIIGGYVRALNLVTATMYGNTSNVRTDIAVGVDSSVSAELAKVDSKIHEIEKDIQKLEAAVNKIDAALKAQMNKELLNKKITLARMLKEKQAEAEPMQRKKRQWMEKIERSAHSKIMVDKMMHEGTVLHINSINKMIRGDATYNVTWKLVDDEMCMVSNI